MSEYTAIRGISRTPRSLLREHITFSSEPGLNAVNTDLRSPREMREERLPGAGAFLDKEVPSE